MNYKNAYHYMFDCISIFSSSLEQPREGGEAVDVPKYLTQILAECEELRINSSAYTLHKASRCGSSEVEHYPNT